jgi:hypothetical protein
MLDISMPGWTASSCSAVTKCPHGPRPIVMLTALDTRNGEHPKGRGRRFLGQTFKPMQITKDIAEIIEAHTERS